MQNAYMSPGINTRHIFATLLCDIVPKADIKRVVVGKSKLEKVDHEICSMSRLLVATGFPNSDASEQQSENGDNDEDELLEESRSSASTAVGQQGVHLQQRNQQWRKTGAHVDGNNCQQHIKPLIKSPQHQLQPHLRLSHTSLTSGCKSMDFCYADER
ncbi:Uncharacterized protein APZ42_013752 [Daphnia magna]|uniref:Uncharacterized protein n=1 Tax=Daphnia magna TaxID=35525 RepID=A0A162QJ34_9CRUS|nr:Uncharacterized protein APZ42_013752 [Daphnia magna]